MSQLLNSISHSQNLGFLKPRIFRLIALSQSLSFPPLRPHFLLQRDSIGFLIVFYSIWWQNDLLLPPTVGVRYLSRPCFGSFTCSLLLKFTAEIVEIIFFFPGFGILRYVFGFPRASFDITFMLDFFWNIGAFAWTEASFFTIPIASGFKDDRTCFGVLDMLIKLSVFGFTFDSVVRLWAK